MKTKSIKILGFFLTSIFFLFVFTQCDSPNNTETTDNDGLGDDTEMMEDNEGVIDEGMDQTEANWQTEQQRWEAALESRLQELDQDMEQASGEAQTELQTERDELNNDLQKVQNATEESWNEL